LDAWRGGQLFVGCYLDLQEDLPVYRSISVKGEALFHG